MLESQVKYQIERDRKVVVVGPEHLGSALRMMREQAGLSQRQLEIKSGVARSSIQQIEAGRVCKQATIQALVDALAVGDLRVTYSPGWERVEV